jgi:hypothetical protein
LREDFNYGHGRSPLSGRDRGHHSFDDGLTDTSSGQGNPDLDDEHDGYWVRQLMRDPEFARMIQRNDQLAAWWRKVSGLSDADDNMQDFYDQGDRRQYGNQGGGRRIANSAGLQCIEVEEGSFQSPRTVESLASNRRAEMVRQLPAPVLNQLGATGVPDLDEFGQATGLFEQLVNGEDGRRTRALIANAARRT